MFIYLTDHIRIVRYQISSMPITESYDEDFIASFVFLGEKLPKVKLQSDYSDGKVISIYEYDKEKREQKLQMIVAIIVISALLLFLFFIIATEKKQKKKFIKKLSDSAKNLDGYDLPKETLVKIVITSYESAIKTDFKKFFNFMKKSWCSLTISLL